MLKPKFENFEAQIADVFGQSLTQPARDAAKDLWTNWTALSKQLHANELIIEVDPILLGHNFPDLNRYHAWKGGGKILVVLGVLLVWFYWMIGIALLLVGIGVHLYGDKIRKSDVKKFVGNLVRQAKDNSYDGGFASLCAHYIAGTISLVGANGSAHWPQHPSNALVGGNSFIDTTAA